VPRKSFERDAGKRLAVQSRANDLYEFTERWQLRPRRRAESEQCLDVGAFGLEIACVVKVAETGARPVEAVDPDRGLGMLCPVGDPTRVGEMVGVNLNQNEAAPRELLLDVIDQRSIDRQFLNIETEHRFEICRGDLEESELVAFEILRHAHAEGCGRFAAKRMQRLDEEIAVTVRFRPWPRGIVQRMSRIGCRGQLRKDGGHGQPQSASRTDAGQAFTSVP
jgi:hypothetical protein